MSPGAAPAFTDCGLPGIRQVPYGVHMCHFYRTGEGLVSALVPYLAAGLRSNERCLCIAPDTAVFTETLHGLEAAGIDVAREITRKALKIRDDAGWHSARLVTAEDAVEGWLAKERRALEDGYQGLRIAGNTTRVPPEDWDRHLEYEAVFNQRLWRQRIVTLCTYELAHCPASGVLDVVRNHSCMLDHPDDGWQLLTQR